MQGVNIQASTLVGLAAAVNTVYTNAADLTAQPGRWLGNEPDAWCTDGTTQVTIGAHLGLVLGGVELPAKAQTNLTLNSAFSGTGWWYVYAKSDGAATPAVTYEFSQTAPDAYRVLKTGDATRRFICSVYVTVATAAAERVLSFHKSRGRVHYRFAGLGINSFRALSAGSATSATDVSLATFLPPHARIAELQLMMLNGTTGTAYAAKVAPKGDTIAASAAEDCQLCITTIAGDVTGSPQRMRGLTLTDSSQVVSYLVSGASVALTIHVCSFIDN